LQTNTSNMAKITLENMEFHAYHGCFQEERAVGTKYIVSVSVEVNIDNAILSDMLSDTVNYQAIYDIVKAEMAIPSNLIEHVCGRIKHAIKIQIPLIEKVEINLSKYNPPLGGQVEKVTISC
jgi:7,8-dihydroneopterin aldolase/epimerase/oxygenase